MSIQQTDTTLSVTIPSIPILAAYIPQLEKPIHIDIPLTQVKGSLRFIVIVLTYLLFRPHLEKLFRTMTDRQSQEEVQVSERMDFIKRQQDPKGASKKSYAIATPNGKDATSDSPNNATPTPASGRPKRRKA